MIKEISATNMPNGGWTRHFTVSGGPFNGDQTMGWHITDESGHTLAVSARHDFVQQITDGLMLMHLLKKADAKYHLGERRDQGYLDHMKAKQWDELYELLKKYCA